MIQDPTPARTLLSRIRGWCGVTVDTSGPVPMVRLKGQVIARFPSEDSFESVLFGNLRTQMQEDPDELPEGVWPTTDHERLLVDLNAPGGMETAFRALMSSFIASQSSAARDWWMDPRNLTEDPTCEKIAQVIQSHREKMMATS